MKIVAWGVRRLRRRRTIAGGYGNPLRVPMKIVAWGSRRLRRRRTIAGGYGNPLRVPMKIAAWGARHGTIVAGHDDIRSVWRSRRLCKEGRLA